MRKFRWLTLVLACFAYLLPTHIYAEETFHIKEGRYLWDVWEAPPYREAFPSWEKFKEEVARINNLPNTEKAFRTLERNRELKLPNLPRAEVYAHQIAMLEAEVQSLKNKFHEADRAHEKEISRLNDVAASEARWQGIWRNGLVMAIALLIVVVLVFGWESRQARKKKEILVQRIADFETKNQELEFLGHYARRYLEPVEIPRNIARVIDGRSNRIYLPKADPIEGDPAVILPAKGPVKIKRLNHNLAHSNDEDLRELGLERTHARVMAS